MNQQRVRISDIAEELGLSTATVSNVIHGKTKKISDETVKRVQKLLEERQYIPSMAGILLAQNNSKIIGVVINDDDKYEGHTLEDYFVASSINALAREIEERDYFLMLKLSRCWDEIPAFASMWNMEGMVLIGFCEQDYGKLREKMHIPFVVYDGAFESVSGIANIEADHFDGGRQVGEYLLNLGHKKILCIADNDICMDLKRYLGLKSVIPDAELMIVPAEREDRIRFYDAHLQKIQENTAVFAVSDYYAIDFINYCKARGMNIPEDLSVVGFDGTRESSTVVPALTTIHQNNDDRAMLAMNLITGLKNSDITDETIHLPVRLVERDSCKKIC